MEAANFDHAFSRKLNPLINAPKNLAQLIFDTISHRDENAVILLSHDNTEYVEISLARFRHIIHSLHHVFIHKGIGIGDTVLLANVPGNNEMYTALMFAALTSFGTRVLLPMFLETNELFEWLEENNCHVGFLPEEDILSLHHHDKEKQLIKKIRDISSHWEFICYDSFTDCKIRDLLHSEIASANYTSTELYENIYQNTSFETESLLISTSGSTGKSKLVTYCQGAFILSCISWLQAGLFDKDLLGGRCFTPMFTHTMGIRAFFNAVWTGYPVCIINTEWFLEKPETVRYLLLQMRPEHITGGPSIYNLLLELMRSFPELKDELPCSFKTLVSSGAPIDKKTSAEIESAFGLNLYNAFGTTETQQVLNTLLLPYREKQDRESMGAPLPGVDIGLKKVRGEKDLYELHVHSVFGMKTGPANKEISTDTPENYFYTGDIVQLKEQNQLFYAGRENRDFIKDGFGVKIPVNRLQNYYQRLISKSLHTEFFPLRGTPGLAALIFIKSTLCAEGAVFEEKILKHYSALITEVNNRLWKILEPFEYRHRSIIRFVLINAEVPRTVKGTVSGFNIRMQYSEEINNLIDPLGTGQYIRDVQASEFMENLYTRHHNSYFGKMMLALSIDYSYNRSQKDSLFCLHQGKDLEILDYTGGFGTNLLGHNNERINKTVTDFIEKKEIPLSDQGSIQKYAGELAEKLNLIVGDLTHRSYNVLFGSTGSEAVEMALHHAYLELKKNFDNIRKNQYERYGYETGELVKKIWIENEFHLSKNEVFFLSLKDGFHGHSSGARAVLGNAIKREKFNNILGIKSIPIDDKADDWQEEIAKAIKASKIKLKKVSWKNHAYVIEMFDFSVIIGAIAEPIIGEGGIRTVNPDFLKYLGSFDFPLIMDEIQCGLGRSGSFLASRGIQAGYYLFAKTLGGNIEKISALLIDKNRYISEFPDYYSSTFANGGLAARVALETLSIIEEENIPLKALESGNFITKKLNEVQKIYPDVIAEISGKGLMQGIKFCDFSKSGNVFLRCIYNEKYLGLLFSAYLLKKHHIRILPSISSPNVLRIEPSAYISDAEICTLQSALEDLCDKVKNKRMYEIFKPLMDNDPFTDNKGKLPKEGFMFTGLEEPLPGAEKVAIIAHFVYPHAELRALDPDLCKASDTGLRILFNRFQIVMQAKPFVLFSKNILNGKIHFSFITLPVDSAELDKRIRQKKQRKIIEKIQEAVSLAENQGIKTVSLGAYTSIISNNGLALAESKTTRIITGNTLTAASGFIRLKKTIEEELNHQPKRLAIVGASGNIGSILAQLFLESDIAFEEIYLFGRNINKLRTVFTEIPFVVAAHENIYLKTEHDLSLLKNCNIILASVNCNDPVVFPHHIHHNKKVVISDLSIPRAISKEVYDLVNVVPVNFASYIKLPGEHDFVISSHTPRGTVFCCAAEAILNGFEPVDCNLKGKISMDGIRKMSLLARKYHFLDIKNKAVAIK